MSEVWKRNELKDTVISISNSHLVSDIARNIGGGLEVDVFIKGRHRKIQHRVQIELGFRLGLVILGGGKRILGGVR